MQFGGPGGCLESLEAIWKPGMLLIEAQEEIWRRRLRFGYPGRILEFQEATWMLCGRAGEHFNAQDAIWTPGILFGAQEIIRTPRKLFGDPRRNLQA